jgi:DNA-binding response OmpR family regulator
MHELPPIIAILEDDLPLQELFVDLFTDEGYRVVCYPDSNSLLRALGQASPTLILLDLHPRNCRGGVPILAALRQNPAAAHVPVMLMTTDSALLAAHAESIRELRAVVQARPFDIAELLDNVVAAIGVLPTITLPLAPIVALNPYHPPLALPGSIALAW